LIQAQPVIESPVAPPPRWLLTAIMMGLMAFGLLATMICLPSMQDWPALFGVSTAEVQLVLSGFLVTFGGLQIVYGAASDQVGRKPLVLVGLLVATLASVLAALAQNMPMLVAARVLQGAGCASGLVLGRAMVQDYFVGHGRTRMMAAVGILLSVTPMLGILLGGQIHAWLGWRANFVLLTLFGATLFVVTWRWMPSPARPGRREAVTWRGLAGGYARLFRHPVYRVYAAISFIPNGTFYTVMAGAPFVLSAGYGIKPENIGWYIMCMPVSFLLGSLITSGLVRRHGHLAVMAAGHAFGIAGVVLVLGLALAGVNSPLALVLPLLLVGFGNALFMPSALVGLVSSVPALAGSGAGLAGLLQQLTGALAAFLTGLIAHDTPVQLGWLMLAWSLLGVAAQCALPAATREAPG
jgi:DHA1 family bicyclomycin/chloramphenicol resistance-like MFS transporter